MTQNTSKPGVSSHLLSRHAPSFKRTATEINATERTELSQPMDYVSYEPLSPSNFRLQRMFRTDWLTDYPVGPLLLLLLQKRNVIEFARREDERGETPFSVGRHILRVVSHILIPL